MESAKTERGQVHRGHFLRRWGQKWTKEKWSEQSRAATSRVPKDCISECIPLSGAFRSAQMQNWLIDVQT